MNTIIPVKNENFNIKIGTFNKKHPDTFFVEGSVYIKPKENDNFEHVLKEISKSFSNSIKKMIGNTKIFNKKYISVVYFPYERMKPNKKTYMTFEYHMIQNNIKPIDVLAKDKEVFISPILGLLKEDLEEHGLTIYKTK